MKEDFQDQLDTPVAFINLSATYDTVRSINQDHEYYTAMLRHKCFQTVMGNEISFQKNLSRVCTGFCVGLSIIQFILVEHA